MNKAYKFRLYPNKKQVELLSKCFGCNRFTYNYFLEMKINAYKNGGVNLSYTKMANILALMKREEEHAFL
ncbi:MAG: transposase, partial [Erysipelotrichaceae bacterium]|nr:transposase [Erysipelotrichaceae bacterium]